MVSLFAILGFAMLFVIIFSATIFAVKVHVITGIIFLLIFILACTAFIYVMAFCQLLIVHTLIRETKGTLMQNIRDVKGHVWEFVWFMIASSLFFIGLIPFGFLSLFVIFFLWAFWGYFSTFIFLTHRKKGLDNLWASYAMVNQRFWGIAGRMVLIMVGYFVIMSFLNIPYDPEHVGSASMILMILQFVVGLIFGAFILCYYYEIFKLLKVPEKVERPKVWVALSVIGGVLMLLLLFLSGREIINGGDRMKDYLKNNYENDYQDKQLPSGVSNHVRHPRSS
jgi:hypothetical protein